MVKKLAKRQVDMPIGLTIAPVATTPAIYESSVLGQTGVLMGSRSTIMSLTLVLTLALSTAAAAHDHEPPKVMLKSRENSQKALLGTYCWVKATGEPGLFLSQCADATWSFPRAREARAGRKARIRFYKAQPPKNLSLRRWRQLNSSGSPRGRGRSVHYELFKRTLYGEVVYDAAFRLPRKNGHVYFAALAKWDDIEGSGSEQDAYWTFHLKLK